MASDPVLPDGVMLRDVTEPADFARIAAMESEVWGEDWSWLADDLASRVAADPASSPCSSPRPAATVVERRVARLQPGHRVCRTVGRIDAQARGADAGIYSALVARRAQLAAERGVKYLQVDASDDSRPILERLGFVAVTTTTPYIWTPPSG